MSLWEPHGPSQVHKGTTGTLGIPIPTSRSPRPRHLFHGPNSLTMLPRGSRVGSPWAMELLRLCSSGGWAGGRRQGELDSLVAASEVEANGETSDLPGYWVVITHPSYLPIFTPTRASPSLSLYQCPLQTHLSHPPNHLSPSSHCPKGAPTCWQDSLVATKDSSRVGPHPIREEGRRKRR